jgi:hypothetical protein
LHGAVLSLGDGHGDYRAPRVRGCTRPGGARGKRDGKKQSGKKGGHSAGDCTTARASWA